MTTAAAFIQFSVVSLLVFAALAKLGSLPVFAATLDLLGVPAVVARRLVWAVTIIELGTAGSIGFEPAAVQGMIVAGLGLVFVPTVVAAVSAGALCSPGPARVAPTQGVRMRCACLGAGWGWRGGPPVLGSASGWRP